MSGALFRPGDYTSAGYPFEPQGPVYLDGDSDPNRRETSLKFGFYPLANVKDKDLLEQYHLVQPLMEKKDDPRFRARLRQGLVELLTAVDRDVQSNCRIKGLKITRIGLSIPAQWTLEFEDVYREIAMQVFGYIGGNIEANIFFHTETEALAHFLLHETPEHFQVRESEDYRVFLFLDFGGHNMNGCIFNLVQRDQNESPSFYRIGDAFGVGGGSEHWTFNIGKRVLHEMRNSTGMSLSLEEQRDMLESFNIKKGSLGPSRARANQPFKFGPCPVSMSLEDITECFEKGHKNVFEKAKGEIELVSEYKAVPQVIISGGTAKHTDVQIRLRGFCNAAGIPEPWFVSGSSMTYSSGKIAHGVAMAASNCLTIPEFMARGAAFGLQTRECANRGNTNPNNLWNDVGYFLLSQVFLLRRSLRKQSIS
ncbi:uncharacterized protein CTRU02_212781 [Colletotrichum truncatum]|uniref:Uncharacterized protein n=1 Tax=Colletotrichum truncatum TaxID=5467 RepID=A0ACC3YIV0_COLTU